MSRATQGLSASDLACLRGERLVFSGLACAVPPGAALLLSGPNGSGKSSLLRVLAGLLPAVAGVVAWDGVPVGEDPEAHRARLHYVGHSDAVKPVLTVRENVAFWCRLRGGHASEAIDEGLARLGIMDLAAVPGRFLSAGQRRRTNLARLLAAPAPLWLLDEPTVGLDDQALEALEAATASHLASGGILVAATHGGLKITPCETLRLDEFAPHAAMEPA